MAFSAFSDKAVQHPDVYSIIVAIEEPVLMRFDPHAKFKEVFLVDDFLCIGHGEPSSCFKPIGQCLKRLYHGWRLLCKKATHLRRKCYALRFFVLLFFRPSVFSGVP